MIRESPPVEARGIPQRSFEKAAREKPLPREPPEWPFLSACRSGRMSAIRHMPESPSGHESNIIRPERGEAMRGKVRGASPLFYYLSFSRYSSNIAFSFGKAGVPFRALYARTSDVAFASFREKITYPLTSSPGRGRTRIFFSIP